MKTFCPQCGPHVDTDADGCCASCGATATGDAVDELAHLIRVMAKNEAHVIALVYDTFADKPGDAVQELLMKIPTIQGTAQRLYVAQIGQGEPDIIKAGAMLQKLAGKA